VQSRQVPGPEPWRLLSTPPVEVDVAMEAAGDRYADLDMAGDCLHLLAYALGDLHQRFQRGDRRFKVARSSGSSVAASLRRSRARREAESVIVVYAHCNGVVS
jgi:hypothetical protein